MKISIKEVLNNRTGLLFAFLFLLLACDHRVNKVSIEGDFVVTGASIFLTNAIEEKEDLFNTCVSRKFLIKANKLYADSACGMFGSVKEITIVDSFQTTVDSFPVMNPASFAYFVDGDIESHRSIWVFKAQEVFSDGDKDSLFIVKKSIDTIILAQDPFFLEMVRVKGIDSTAK